MLAHLHKFVPKYKLKFKRFSTQEASKPTIKYTNTVNLPKTKFPSRLSTAKRYEIEQNLVQTSFATLYQYQRANKTGSEFVLHDGPPYANGDLHMGHAVNKILKDITLRQHVSHGRRVDFKPGWDCHGLPIELKAMAGQNNLDPVEIRRRSRLFATEASDAQRKEFESWGVMADWNNPSNLYRTYRPEYIQRQYEIFLDLYKKGLVYRDLKPVFWSPSSRTALAEAELEYDQNFTSPSIILRLKLARVPTKLQNSLGDSRKIFGLIWTTTPWTLPSNQAVCYNPLLEYSIVQIEGENDSAYIIASKLLSEFSITTSKNVEVLTTLLGNDLQNSTYFHPIDENSELPFLPSQHVQDNKGTGLVHTAPAHGPDDFLIGLKNNLPIKSLVDENGEYNEQAPVFLISKSVLDEGSTLVMNYLQNDLLHVGKIIHSYPIDWRTKKPVILRASEQWFINTEKIKGKAIEEIRNVNIYPISSSDANKRTLIAQLEKRPYWCISRQRAWGVPIPVFYEKSTKRPIIDDQTIKAVSDLLSKNCNMDFWWNKNFINLLPKEVWNDFKVEPDNLVPGKDIFDIWFDSGISWSYALGKARIADLYLEGYDQFTGWFQSSLMTSVAYRNCAPYKSIFVHGFTVDEKGHKMSKSLGNVILPRDIIKKYGVDVLRWWVASHGPQHSSITVSDSLLQSCAESLNKVRLTLKFLNGTIGKKKAVVDMVESTNYLNKYIRHELYKFDREIQDLYDNYEYNRVTAVVQNFIANQMSAVYLNLIKDRLYCGNQSEIMETQNVLTDCYHVLCRALWPIVPFVVEESWSYYDKLRFYETEKKASNFWLDNDAESVVNTALELKQVLNQTIKSVNTWTLDVTVKCNIDKLEVLKCLHPKVEEKLNSTELCEILQVSSIVLVPSDVNNFTVDCHTIKNNICPRCRRFSIDESENVCNRCDNVLVQNGFS